MEVSSKQVKSKSHEEFEKLLSQDLGSRKFKEGEIAMSELVDKAWPDIEKILNESPKISEAVAEVLADQCLKGKIDPADKEKIKEETVKIVLAMLSEYQKQQEKK